MSGCTVIERFKHLNIEMQKSTYMNEFKLSDAARQLKRGRYQHFKGKEYEVLDIAFHSETGEELVVYRALYGEKKLFVRPLPMFLEEVERDGRRMPRFMYLKE